MKKILLAGVTGYLGGYIAEELRKRDYHVRAIVRDPGKLNVEVDETLRAEVTQPGTIKECCRDIDAVISTVGITRQRDGLTYMDVDYNANVNLLNEAKEGRVRKFIYVSVLNGQKLRNLEICGAKEKFADELKISGLDYCVIRPNGFFSDMLEFYNMARKGRVYLFGDGNAKANPIHGEDLAEVCVNAIAGAEKEIDVGGPQTYTQNEIADLAFESLGIDRAVTHLPDWIRVVLLKLVRTFTSSRTYGPLEFFMSVMAIDMIAPEYGKHTLKEFYARQSKNAT